MASFDFFGRSAFPALSLSSEEDKESETSIDGKVPEAGEVAETPPQLRTINPAEIHKRAAAAMATSPLLSFDVSGCLILIMRYS